MVGDNLTHLTPYAAASVLADAIRDEKADLVMTGLQSDDYGYGQTGVIMAELLGLPHATIVIELAVGLAVGIAAQTASIARWNAG